MSDKIRIGVLNSGGDCPGLNAVIHGVTGAATQLGWEVIGFRDGFEGLLPPGNHLKLDPTKTAGIMKLGGTILGTVNRGHFVSITGRDNAQHVAGEVLSQSRATIERLGVRALIVVGGDGSLTTSLQIQEAGIPVVGVPKTIDNDLSATAMTFGFDSAVTCVVDSLDRLNTTGDSHKRVMVLEVMGRHAGWIALHGGIAGGADVILIPEIPFTHESVAAAVTERERRGYHSALVVVAEGACPVGGHLVGEDIGGAGQIKLKGVSHSVTNEIERRTGKETRSVILGHLQRGGAPTALDRILGIRFGVKAVLLVKEGLFGHMVSYQSYHVGSVPIAEAVAKLRVVDPAGELVNSARAIGIRFGNE
jgi:ATP-dependent phosphofructokinase / diphosphate-dependent phosphofructokinase